jgi:uncharacterized Zn finger protein (UPF0148 family)
MSQDEKNPRDEAEPLGSSERRDTELADTLAVAEEHEPDLEKLQYLHAMRERAEVRAEKGRRAREDSWISRVPNETSSLRR